MMAHLKNILSCYTNLPINTQDPKKYINSKIRFFWYGDYSKCRIFKPGFYKVLFYFKCLIATTSLVSISSYISSSDESSDPIASTISTTIEGIK